MATTSYTWIHRTSPLTANNVLTAGDQAGAAIAANLARTHYFSAWTSAGDGVRGRLFNADGSPAANEFAISPAAPLEQRDVSLAALNDSRYVAIYNDAKDLRARIINADGSPGEIIDISIGAPNDTRCDVTALADGGFAVAWTRIGAGNLDIMASVYNADGSLRHGPAPISVNGNDAALPSIIGLAGGGFVVAWEETTGPAETEIRFRRFDAAGTPLSGTDTEGKLVDTWGDYNRDAQLAALPDGGFAIAYVDNGWNGGATAKDITVQVYNANGSARSSSSFANSQFVIGDQLNPTLSVLQSGHFVVSWSDPSRQWFQTYDASGNKLGENHVMMHDVVSGEIAALRGSMHAVTWQSTDTDGSGTSIKTELIELERVISGNNGNETINSYGDGIFEILQGKGGQDTLNGGAGNGMFAGGDGQDVINGGAGDDAAVFNASLDNHIVYDFGSKIVVWGPGGLDTLTGIEHLHFSGDWIDVVDDGNALFDALYYLSRNIDVFEAGADAFTHFATSGWHEGRDPNGYFSISDYLAVNKDVAAAGTNPLDHYHNSGWHEGRDPSVLFDTTLYLVRNPDVAAAGVDPLGHFLRFGYAEERQAYLAIGTAVDGFDAQYYLMTNADVAAAGIDPQLHFNLSGWHEGRRPNRWFDTDGYLAHNPDVAAAGVNPLWHYQAIGWKEGRDPSTGFDTLKYLAANPDVAAAGVRPLDHFINHGIYEGRLPMGDGMWT
jgi:hypothetical protein